MEKMREKEINIFEIGICEGASLKMWEEYFLNGQIYAMDYAEDGSMRISSDFIMSLNTGRAHTFIGDQNKREDLNKCMNKFNTKFDIMIDDGHHFQSPQQVSLGFLFSYLKSGGLYVIEDICSIWNMKNGSEWGQKDRINFTDSTQKILENFLEKGSFSSQYMTNEESDYVNKNIESIKMFYPRQFQRGELLGPKTPDSPNIGTSIVAIIKKK